MRKIIYITIAATLLTIGFTGCRFAPSQDMGDTVAASVFAPIDTAALNKARLKKAQQMMKDSIGIYYIGDGSNREQLQLVSYPSRRDTLMIGKAKKINVKGSADFGRITRATFVKLETGDSIVTSLEEVTFQAHTTLNTEKQGAKDKKNKE